MNHPKTSPTIKELERYLLEHGSTYGQSDIERRIRRRDSVGNLVCVYNGETGPVVIKATIGCDLLNSLEAYQRRTGKAVHVFILEEPEGISKEHLTNVHLLEVDDIRSWLADHRAEVMDNDKKGSLSAMLRSVVSYLERKEVTIVGPEVIAEYLSAEAGGERETDERDRRRAIDLIQRLTKKRWLRRLTRNRYLLLPLRSKETLWSEDPLVVASNIVSPSYVSYGAALSFHGLTDQVMYRIDVATLRRHSPFEFQSVFYNFIAIREHKFFGFMEEGAGPQPAVVAKPEKAIVDVLDGMPYFSDAADPVGALLYGEDTLDLDRLVDYTLRMRSGALCRRLGYLLELFKEKEVLVGVGNAHLDRLRSAMGDYWTYTLLSTAAPESGRRVERWRVVDNVDIPSVIESRWVL